MQGDFKVAVALALLVTGMAPGSVIPALQQHHSFTYLCKSQQLLTWVRDESDKAAALSPV